jgi:hypothetical protein
LTLEVKSYLHLYLFCFFKYSQNITSLWTLLLDEKNVKIIDQKALRKEYPDYAEYFDEVMKSSEKKSQIELEEIFSDGEKQNLRALNAFLSRLRTDRKKQNKKVSNFLLTFKAFSDLTPHLF